MYRKGLSGNFAVVCEETASFWQVNQDFDQFDLDDIGEA